MLTEDQMGIIKVRNFIYSPILTDERYPFQQDQIRNTPAILSESILAQWWSSRWKMVDDPQSHPTASLRPACARRFSEKIVCNKEENFKWASLSSLQCVYCNLDILRNVFSIGNCHKVTIMLLYIKYQLVKKPINKKNNNYIKQ